MSDATDLADIRRRIDGIDEAMNAFNGIDLDGP